jgi:hypothetical protein
VAERCSGGKRKPADNGAMLFDNLGFGRVEPTCASRVSEDDAPEDVMMIWPRTNTAISCLTYVPLDLWVVSLGFLVASIRET